MTAKLNSIGAMPIFPASRCVHCAALALTPRQPFNRVRASKPSFLKPGRWTEFEGKSNERYETRHFVYLVPGESPAIELYIAANRNGDPPDGVFEVGLVKGFLSGFAGKASLRCGKASPSPHSFVCVGGKQPTIPASDQKARPCRDRTGQ